MSGLPYSSAEWGGVGEFLELPEGKVFAVRKCAGPPLVLPHSYGSKALTAHARRT